jgi:hypothetical protein
MNLLLPFCPCFNFWTSRDDQMDLDGLLVDGNSRQCEQDADVCLDVSKAGQDVVIVKSGKRLCGTGGALGTLPIIQNKAYFEVKIQAQGEWGVGLATRKVDLNKVPLGNDSESWVLRQDGCVYSDNSIRFRASQTVDEGDIIGVTYDHELLNFYLNGDDLETSITGIRGTVYPVFYGKSFFCSITCLVFIFRKFHSCFMFFFVCLKWTKERF